jgi:hypothetical protein
MKKKNTPSKPKAKKAWGLYRPNGTLMRVFQPKSMNKEREDFLLRDAWSEIKDEEDHRAGTPVPEASDKARELGYRVIQVNVTPVVFTNAPKPKAEKR